MLRVHTFGASLIGTNDVCYVFCINNTEKCFEMLVSRLLPLVIVLGTISLRSIGTILIQEPSVNQVYWS